MMEPGSPRAGALAAPPRSDSDARAVRVLSVDDQELFRSVARAVIDATPGFALVGEAPGGQEALEAVDRCAPDLVLLDVRMPGMDGIEVAARLHATHPETVVVLISIDEPIDLPSAELGASAFVRKQDFSSQSLRRLWKQHRP